MFKITKENIIGRFFQIFFIAVALLIMYLGGWKFFIVSFIFFGIGGAFEFIIINRFNSNSKNNISKNAIDSNTKGGLILSKSNKNNIFQT